MCDSNINSIVDLDFSSISDEFNWINNTQNTIETVGGKLLIRPDGPNSIISRSLGAIDPANNRIKIEMLLDLVRPQSSTDTTICVDVDVLVDGSVVDTFTIYLDNLDPGSSVEYYFERSYKFENLVGTASIRFRFPEGWNNQIALTYLKASDLTFCDDNVRTFFVINNLLEDAINSVSSTIQLQEWNIDGVETLTPDFFNDQVIGADPSNDWFLAKARIDGQNRESNTVNPNTFNPFRFHWNLDFENVAGNFHGGKAIGTTTGNNYGSGILNVGFEEPSILNELLNIKDGAFFIDIDFTKSLRVVFDVVINNTSPNVFQSPAVFKRYTILFDPTKCETSFSYVDQLKGETRNVDEDGFLSGITGAFIDDNVIDCDESFEFNGESGTYEFEINFGSDVGLAGISYEAFNVPDKFEIEWNNQVFSTGYVGSNIFDQQLINLGILPSEINTAQPPNGTGELLFDKNQADPQTAIVRVTAPLSNTGWNINGICPGTGNPNPSIVLEVAPGVCGDSPRVWSDVFVDTPNPLFYNPQNGDQLFVDDQLITPFNGSGNTYLMRINDNGNFNQFNVQFDVSATGVISNVQSCQINPQPSDPIEILSVSNLPCQTCWTVQINVPEGETREVVWLSSFAPSGRYTNGQCIGPVGSIEPFTDSSVVINETTTFLFGIDGANNVSGTLGTSVIVLSVNDGPITVSQINLTRQHQDANC